MPILEITLILLLGNLKSLLSWLTNEPTGTGALNLLLAVLIYLYVLLRQRPLSDLGQSFRFSFKNSAIAIGAGIALTIPPLLFFLFPVVVGSLDYTPIKSLPTSAFLLRILLEIPFTTALSEEILFRHYLYQKFKFKTLTTTLLFHTTLFTLWHIVVGWRTVLDTNLSTNLFLTCLSYFGALLSIFVGGVIFLLVRHLTGSFLYSALTHWITVASMIIIIWLIN